MYLIAYLNDLLIRLLLKYTFSGFNKNGMKMERKLRARLIVHLVLLVYWFPTLIADTVIQFQTEYVQEYGTDGHIFTDYATNWCSVLILVHLITAITITAMDMKNQGVTELLILLRNRVTNVAMVMSLLITLNFAVLQVGLYKVSKWTLQYTHEHLMNSIVMLISVFSLNSHFRKRDFWLGK